MARPDSGLSNLLPPVKSGFPSKSFSLSESELLAQEKDLCITSLSLNMWGSKFLASLIAEEASTSPLSFLTSLESVVRSFRRFSVIIARHLINLMAGTTHLCRDCVLKLVDPQVTEVPVLEDSRQAARWWLDQGTSVSTLVTITNFSHCLFTDACPMGWGAHLDGDML